MKKIPYSDKLDADQQVSTEEKIAVYLLQSDGREDEDEDFPNDRSVSPTDKDLNQAARDILYIVLREFRPDLLEKDEDYDEETARDYPGDIDPADLA